MLEEIKQIYECQPAIDWLRARYIEPVANDEPVPLKHGIEPDMEEIEVALSFISADSYDDWLTVGMALKSADIEMSVWDTWSKTAASKYDSGAIEPKWKSFRSKGITLGSVFYIAKKNGYRPSSIQTGADGHQNQASRLLALVESDSSFKAFKTPSGEGFGTYIKKYSSVQIAETVPLNSEPFASFLRNLYRANFRSLCGTESINTVTSYLYGDAGIEPQVFVRVAHHEGNIFVDLANEHRQVVQISASSWQVISSDKCPVHFWRPAGMLALPVPESGGSLDCLSKFMNLSGETANESSLLKRVILYLVSTFVDGPLIVLEIVGEKGSAKTSQARIIRKILDPNEADVMSPPSEDRDLCLACRNQWVVAIDNASSISNSRSDLHCRISTGAAWRERQLHTNSGEFLYRFRRPQIITAIKDVITKSDLADRKLKLRLAQIPGENRRTEKAILKAFDLELPRILGALYWLLSGTLRELPHVAPSSLPRMADAAEFLLAAEKSLMWKDGTVASMFAQEAVSDAEDMLDGNPFAGSLSVRPMRHVVEE